MKLLFVVNPISGGVDKKPFLREAESLCNNYGIEYSIFKTTGVNDEEGVKKIIDEFQPNKVASVGGDGTTLFTAIALLETKIPMGIIPLGSANGMAVELFVNPKPIEALKNIIMSDVIGHLDMVKVNGEHYSIHIGDVGINAQIVEAYDKDENRGMVTYAKYFIDEVKKVDLIHVAINANGKSIDKSGIMVCICNSRKYGTGVPINLTGNPMDGKFEIVVVKKIDTNSIIKAGLSKFEEGFYDRENIEILSTDKAQLSFDKPRLLQLDGEVIGKYKDIEVEILSGGVNLISTKNSLSSIVK
ncbi:lipid kinase [Joostella atrarenae]|uniref:Lipid kinase n=1 Tax=Joostella atrarenae TaxID=679257 RepID=A0ABS9J0M9_9FLAO|nr:diacylglycerol kinase family protein [Joostella atrarenae]MCF8713990.1 lipid kinase [Joostella atrarenae]